MGCGCPVFFLKHSRHEWKSKTLHSIETMKLQRATLAAAILALVIAAWCAREIGNLNSRIDSALIGQAQRPPATNPPLQSTNVEQRLKRLEAASCGAGDAMAAIQRHFAKLYFAAEARNWDLAKFEWGELGEKFDAIAAIRPEERGVSISGIIGAFKNTQLEALREAIEVKDRGLFRQAYQDSLQMCNVCHRSTGRPFIMITNPTNAPVPNQRWDIPPVGQ